MRYQLHLVGGRASSNFSTLVCLISAVGEPFLPFALEHLSVPRENLVILLDSRPASAKDNAIWASRTGWEHFSGWTLEKFRADFRDLRVFEVDFGEPDSLSSVLSGPAETVGFNLGLSRLLTEQVLGLFSAGVVNVHPGPLPEYRGSSAVEWALLNGDLVGCTAHAMVKDIDAGPIFLQESYLLPSSFNYRAVRRFVYKRQVAIINRLAGRSLSDIHFLAYGKEQILGGFVYGPTSKDQLDWLQSCPHLTGAGFSGKTLRPRIHIKEFC